MLLFFVLQRKNNMGGSLMSPIDCVDSYRSLLYGIISEVIPQENQVYLRKIVAQTHQVPISSFAKAKEVIEILGAELKSQLSLLQHPYHIGRVTWFTDQMKAHLERFILPQHKQLESYLNDAQREREEMEVVDESSYERDQSTAPPNKRVHREQSALDAQSDSLS